MTLPNTNYQVTHSRSFYQYAIQKQFIEMENYYYKTRKIEIIGIPAFRWNRLLRGLYINVGLRLKLLMSRLGSSQAKIQADSAY